MSSTRDDPSAAAIPFRAVWNRDFTLYFWGVILSLTGFWVRFVAQGWLVYKLTDSAWLLGLVGFFSTLPVFLCSPLAGVVVDRLDRRQLLWLTQAGHLLIILALAVLDTTGWAAIWHIMVLAFLGGVVSAFDWPTRLALVPNLVPAAVLPRAVAFNSAAWNGARIGGPVVAGLLLPLVGTAGSFWVAALLFGPVLAAIPFMRLHSGTSRRTGGDFWGNLRGGYHYILASPLLLTLLLIELVPTIFGQTFPILMPAFVDKVLWSSPSMLGWLMACLGAGELIGTLAIALSERIPRRPLLAMIGVLGFGIMIVLFALARDVIVAMLVLVLAGFFAAAYSTLNGTLIQRGISDEYRGRVMSLYGMIWGLTPIGNLQLGALAEAFGPSLAVATNGLIVAVFIVILLIVAPAMRRL